jgi:leucyl aminopeptidase (aminopeptidase T)
VIEGEKILGTIHIALGTNDSFGGKIHSDLHTDFILPGASVYVNNVPIIVHGVQSIEFEK